jgi:hypothetical protein
VVRAWKTDNPLFVDLEAIDSLKLFFSHSIILIFDSICNALLCNVRVKRAG